jgi:hypothetical protein
MSGAPYASRSDDGIWQGRMGLNSSSYYYNQFECREMGGAPSFESNYMAAIAQSPKYEFEKCKKEHPEFFALINGKREILPNGYTCYTAPGIAKAISEGLCEVVKKFKEKGEKLEHVSIRTRDGWTVCSCEGCMKPIKLPDGNLLKPKADTAQGDLLFFSTRMAMMLNDVAEEFAKTHPDIPITVPAYIYSAVPPAIMYHPSLIPSFCAYDTCSLRFPILDENNNPLWAERFREFLKRNGTDNRKLSMFAYYYPPGFSTVADSAAADWRAMVKSGGVYGVHLDSFTPDMENYNRREQYLHMWDYQAIEKWIIARLMWDPTLDPQKLREYYIKRAYGEAAPEMLEFYNIIRKVWEDPAIKFAPNCHAGNAEMFDTLIVKTGNEEKLRSILVLAAEKAVNPSSKILVQRTLAAFDRFAKTLNRIYIPFIQESTAEWKMANSTFWMQALKLGEFKCVSTWYDAKDSPAKHQTKVSIMRDKQNLYFHFHAFDAGENDRVELILEAKRGSARYFFALDRKGKHYDMKNDSPWDCPDWNGEVKNGKDSYFAMFKIPLSLIKELETSEEDIVLYAKFSRLLSDSNDREESTLTGFSITMTHYMNYWTKLSIKEKE